jgi:chromosome segregation ATPase
MNKIIIIAISSIVGLAIPVIGLTISPTRDILLGLSPDEAVLALADKIDENRVSSEQTDAKIMDLQSTIESQQSEIENYREQIESQNDKIETVNTDVKTTNETVVKQKYCNTEVNKYCVSDSFKYSDEFTDFLKAYESFENYNEYKTKYTTQFDNCQKALKCK